MAQAMAQARDNLPIDVIQKKLRFPEEEDPNKFLIIVREQPTHEQTFEAYWPTNLEMSDLGCNAATAIPKEAKLKPCWTVWTGDQEHIYFTGTLNEGCHNNGIGWVRVDRNKGQEIMEATFRAGLKNPGLKIHVRPMSKGMEWSEEEGDTVSMIYVNIEELEEHDFADKGYENLFYNLGQRTQR